MRIFTNTQDVICDPCMGSGTTLLAAHQLARPRVIGIERDPTPYRIACDRLAPLIAPVQKADDTGGNATQIVDISACTPATPQLDIFPAVH